MGNLKIRWATYAWICLVLVTGCTGNAAVSVDMINSQGDKIGTAVLTEEKEGVKVQFNVSQLSPGPHGFHIHETGKCAAPDFKSAGGHFNPGHKKHGKLNPQGTHAGDLANIVADSDGKAKGAQVAQQVTLSKNQKHSLLKSGGTALVIYEKADDMKTDPAGDSGRRIACGTI
ncbi:superoxide dismutase family protein [Laceyella putida]|uniref:Superoxide dismutase [Cu-Zn] n=1 Tax=Laceyella putida TaxID=110101 RepID=A0ABW2RF87_9BACL